MRPSSARTGASILPGLLLSFAVATGALGLSRLVPAASPALLAILLGALAVNLSLLPTRLKPGLDVAAKPVLRWGIVLLGLQLALGDVLALGAGSLALIAAVVAVGVASGLLLGRVLRLERAQTVLIACGFSICGAAAVAAAQGALEPEPRDGESRQEAIERLETQTATAVALVVVFGTLMIPLLPLAAGALALPQAVAGTWAGASIHEVAQVVAAGSLLGPEALRVAVLVKLGRVVLLAPVIAVITALGRRSAAVPGSASGADPSKAAADRPPLVPRFVLAFLLAIAVRSTGLLPDAVIAASGLVQALLLAAAMFALGTGVRLRLLRQVGGRPIVLAALLTVLVAGIGLGGAVLIGG